jgi:1-acyl-sn-glycerol-3-phosphate acyltransferase
VSDAGRSDGGPPPLGASVPQRGGRLGRTLGALAFRAAGWRFEGRLPDLPRFVAVVAPHTSNWDFPLAMAAMFALGLRVRWLGKHTLFRGPVGALLRWLGGVPVRRGARGGAAADAVDALARAPAMVLALAPEGTRRRVETWRSGYYAIAEGAGVPVVPVWFDWSRRVVGFGAPVAAEGGAEALTARLRTLYRPEMARRRERY